MSQPTRLPCVFPAVFQLAGILAALVAAGWLLENLWFTLTTHSATGEVIGLVDAGGKEDGRYALVRFPAGERHVTIRSQVAWEPPAYSPGQAVTVLYPPGQPERGRVSSFWEHMPAILGGAAAVVFGLVAVAIWDPWEKSAGRPADPRRGRFARAGCLVYVGAFCAGGVGLAVAGAVGLLSPGGVSGTPLFLLLTGLWLIGFCGYQFFAMRTAGRREPERPCAPGDTLRVQLPRDRPGRAGVAVLGFLTLCWNGALAAIVLDLALGRVSGWVPFLIVWVILGGLAGAGMAALLVFVALYEFPALKGVRPTVVEVSDYPLHPGASYEILVTQPGPLRLLTWQLLLVCDETRSYPGEVDRPTEFRTVHHEELIRQEGLVIDDSEPYTARRSFRLPDAAPSSSEVERHRVTWQVVVQGHFTDWRPGFKFEYPFVVVGRPA
jgi:hypothetical protein